MQLKRPKYQKTKDENMGWTKHKSHKLAMLSTTCFEHSSESNFLSHADESCKEKTHVCAPGPEILPWIYDTIYKFTSMKIEEISCEIK